MTALGPVEHLGLLRGAMRAFSPSDPRLRVRVMGLEFPTPIGLAAGLDKNADRARALAALGFGHVELGTVTAEAQEANPAPNLFRLPADRALVNRLGFPNQGADVVGARIAERRSGVGVPIGISIGKSRSVPLDPMSEVLADYTKSFRAVRSAADFVVVNVSSPNTKDLRAIQAADTAKALFDALLAVNADGMAKEVPVLVKIAPDLSDDAIDAIVDVAKEVGLAGVVATNTTIARTGLVTPEETVSAIGAGGLSGKPLFSRSVAVVKRVRARLGPGKCVIGVGGVDGGESALAMLRVGADLVQLYTGFIYRGPTLPGAIARDLLRRMDAEGASSVADLAAGSSPQPPSRGDARAHA